MNAQTNSISSQKTAERDTAAAEQARVIEKLRRSAEERDKEAQLAQEKAREEALAKDAKGAAPDAADQKQEQDDKKFVEKAQDDKERSFEEKRVADKQFEDKQFADRQFDDRKREDEKRQDQKAQDRQPEREEQRKVEETPEKEKFTVQEEQKEAAHDDQLEEKVEAKNQEDLERFAPRHREINRTGQETHSEMLSDRTRSMTFEGRDHPEFLSADRGAEGYKSKDELRGEMTQTKDTQAKEMDQGKGKEASESTSAVSQRLDQRIETAKANYVAAGSPQPSQATREHGQALSAKLDQIEQQKAQQMTMNREKEQTLTR